MKKAIQIRNRIADSLSQAADASRSAELRRQLRDLEREVMRAQSERTDPRWDDELLALAQSLTGYAREGQETVARNTIARIRELLGRRASGSERSETRVGLFNKLKQTFSKSKEAPEDAVRNSTDAALFKLEQEIEVISQQRSAEMDKLRAVIQEAAGYQPDSYEYKHARARAGSIKQQVKLYEGQIDAHFKALMNNQRYLQLIDNGLAMKNLSALVPDPAEADAILEKLTVHVEDWQDKQDAFDDVIKEYGNRVGTSAGALDFEDEEFDRAVSELRAGAQQKPVAEVKADAEKPAVAERRAPIEAEAAGQSIENALEEEPENVNP